MSHSRTFLAALGCCWLAACAAPTAAPAVQTLIDDFVQAMPRDPEELRKPEVRAALAAKALPPMQRIRAHVAANPGSPLASRVHEFVVYSLVLDEPGLRPELQQRAAAGDRQAELLLHSAEVIQAGDTVARQAAIGAVARSLTADTTVADCAVQCLVVAGGLSADEARQLADAGGQAPLAARLRATAEQAELDPRQHVGQPFAVRGTTIDGTPLDSADLRGKVVVLDFWATWCVPCVRSLPDLVSLQREHGEALAIVGISCDDDRDRLTAFLREHQDVSWPQLFAGDGKRWHPLATEFGVAAIPRLFLIDRHGILRSADAKTGLDTLVRRYVAE